MLWLYCWIRCCLLWRRLACLEWMGCRICRLVVYGRVRCLCRLFFRGLAIGIRGIERVSGGGGNGLFRGWSRLRRIYGCCCWGRRDIRGVDRACWIPIVGSCEWVWVLIYCVGTMLLLVGHPGSFYEAIWRIMTFYYSFCQLVRVRSSFSA